MAFGSASDERIVPVTVAWALAFVAMAPFLPRPEALPIGHVLGLVLAWPWVRPAPCPEDTLCEGFTPAGMAMFAGILFMVLASLVAGLFGWVVQWLRARRRERSVRPA